MNEERRPRIMTIDEVSKYLRVNKSTVYRFVKNGELPAMKVGKQWRFKKDSIETFLLDKEKTEI